MLPTLHKKVKGRARGQGRCLWRRAGLSLLSLPPRSDALTAGPPFLLLTSLLLVFAADTSCLFKKAPGQSCTRDERPILLRVQGDGRPPSLCCGMS